MRQSLFRPLLAMLAMLVVLSACAAPAANEPPTPIAVAEVPDPAQLDVAQAEAAPTAAPTTLLDTLPPALPTVAPESEAPPAAEALPEGEAPAEQPAAPTASGPTAIPTPSPRPADEPWRIGLQVGHLRSNELPEELARLRTSTGAQWNGTSEAELNLDIVERIKPILEAEGIIVDVIPATVPPSYEADAFIAIHADGNRATGPRGWKLATPWRSSAASRALMAAIGASYGPATGLPEDVGGVTVNMRGYYAFNNRRYVHAIAQTTPAVIVEMGFMTNARDREVLFGNPDAVARGIAEGIIAYLDQRDRNDGASLVPPTFPNLRAREDGVALRAAPREDARVVKRLTTEDRLFILARENGWYELFVRGEARNGSIGFVREDMLVESTEEPPPVPTSTNP